MKRIECSVVRDILPLYLDDVVSAETRDIVKEHLTECPDCREKAKGLNEELRVPNAPDFQREEAGMLKQKLTRERLLRLVGSGLMLVLMVAVMLSLYSAEYCIDADSTAGLEAALEDIMLIKSYEVDVLDSISVENKLFVFFQAEDIHGISGFARLEKGLFGKYRLIEYDHARASNLYYFYSERVGDENYLFLITLYDLPGVECFGYFEIDKNTGKIKEEPLWAGEAVNGPKILWTTTDHLVDEHNKWVRFYDAEGNELRVADLVKQVDPDQLKPGVGFGGGMQNRNGAKILWTVEFVVLAIGLGMARLFFGPLPRRRRRSRGAQGD